jgi:hypothetical protein
MKIEGNNNIFCSVSSGYSSVYMAIKMKEWYPNHNIVFGMANTSKERIESLEFMNECDKYFNLGLNWIESVIHKKKGKGVDFKIVSFEELKKKGEIFEDGIKAYGIPSVINKWCNRDMKVVPLKKFADSVFGTDNYSIAVGIRIDEMDRVSSSYNVNNIFYPLIENKISKRERNLFWKDQQIKIQIPAFKGNCDLCFEKSNRKLLTIINDDLKSSDWWSDMINKYGSIKIEGKDVYNEVIENNNGATFYRGYKTIQDLVEMAKKPFSKATDEYIYENDLFDLEGDCGSGCTVFN